MKKKSKKVVGLPNFEKTMKDIKDFEKKSRKANIMVGKKYTSKDIERMLQKMDWNKFMNDVDEKIAPVIEAYRVARIKSYHAAKDNVFI